jgi:protein-tyrosine phosphatase/arsenate reductase
MFEKIENLVHHLIKKFDEIPDERKLILNNISNYISQKNAANEEINLVYMCTHNSRRSHFGQLAAVVAASFYKVKNVKSFSGGTEVTSFNQNAIKALQNIGFEISTKKPNANNPWYKVAYNKANFQLCYSKLFDDKSIPQNNFIAIMTCSEAEQNCPFIAGATMRIATTYKDPKEADNTDQAPLIYEERLKQILTETLYAFSKINSNS